MAQCAGTTRKNRRCENEVTPGRTVCGQCKGVPTGSSSAADRVAALDDFDASEPASLDDWDDTGDPETVENVGSDSDRDDPSGRIHGMETIEVTAAEFTFTEGSSNKFYRLYRHGSVYSTQYGAIGVYGTFGTKDLGSEDAATKAFDKEVKKRLSKGYVQTKAVTLVFDKTPTESALDGAMGRTQAGTFAADGATAAPVSAVVTTDDFRPDPEVFGRVLIATGARPQAGVEVSRPVYPMLAQTVDPADLKGLLDSPTYAVQPKYDGDRFVVEVVDGQVSVYGRNGQAKQRDVNRELLAPFGQLTAGRWVFDGEMIAGRTLVLFDMVEAGGQIDQNSTFTQRNEMLARTVGALFGDSQTVKVAETATTPAAKRQMLDDAAANQREGIIVRYAHAPYRAGRSDDLLKHKFIREADCGHRSRPGRQGQRSARRLQRRR